MYVYIHTYIYTYSINLLLSIQKSRARIASYCEVGRTSLHVGGQRLLWYRVIQLDMKLMLVNMSVPTLLQWSLAGMLFPLSHSYLQHPTALQSTLISSTQLKPASKKILSKGSHVVLYRYYTIVVYQTDITKPKVIEFSTLEMAMVAARRAKESRSRPMGSEVERLTWRVRRT